MNKDRKTLKKLIASATEDTRQSRLSPKRISSTHVAMDTSNTTNQAAGENKRKPAMMRRAARRTEQRNNQNQPELWQTQP